MEEKLEAYRRKKRREEVVKGFKEKLVNMVSFQQVRVDSLRNDSAEKANEQVSVDTPEEVANESEKEDLADNADAASLTSETSDMALGAPKRTAFTYFIYVLYFLLWATCYAIAIELQFGVVFFLFSALAAVYLNTRTRPKAPGEISAYSVFNKDCHAIDGTLKAEQFEAELRYAALK
uniref:SAYSvFN domain-containing protein n=1 Tax=Phlebotomus kandelakii TaxID=1109342 RepID=A0A6B2E9B4_9DIPT